MAKRAETSLEKAKAIVATGGWLVEVIEGWGGGEPQPKLARAIAAAYKALQIISENTGRDQVVALFASFELVGGKSTNAERREHIRSFVETVQNGDEHRFSGTPKVASDDAIDAALVAWRRKPGQRSKGLPDRWEATARVLRESGFQGVTAGALEKAWKDPEWVKSRSANGYSRRSR